MRMVQALSPGGPEVLTVGHVAFPVPGPEDVLIAVRMAGVNFADVNVRRATYGRRVDTDHGLGHDVFGEVLEVGADVRGMRPGQRVAGFSNSSAYAEYAVAHHRLVWAVPDGVSDEQAAAFPTVGHTAHHLLETAGRLLPGESVLVTAAAGGVGSVVVQLAGLLGAGRVVAAAGSAERARQMLALGADEAVAYPGMAGIDPVDLALDGVGGEVRCAALDRVVPFGRLVHFGNSCSEPEELPTLRVQRERGVGVVGFHLQLLRSGGLGALAHSAGQLLGLIAEGRLTIPVHAVIPLARAADAHRMLESRQVRGKLLLSVPGTAGEREVSHGS
jgi:NADPH:quinone reductase